MAVSPSHKYGQIIGEMLERAFEKYLKNFTDTKGLYLDTIGPRKARKGKKVSWIDLYGNKHDLDFVLERGGSEEVIGAPVAFIESAWRRYTKHSKNKAQEIQGAIMPLATKHSFSVPFLGVVLAGMFTSGALNQLRSRGFQVLYFDYVSIVRAFETHGIDVAFDEDTTTANLHEKVKVLQEIKNGQTIIDTLVSQNQDIVDNFFSALEKSISRYVSSVNIQPLYGINKALSSIKEAIEYLLENEFKQSTSKDLVRFEVKIIYNNDDKIEAQFEEKQDAIDFLTSYAV